MKAHPKGGIRYDYRSGSRTPDSSGAFKPPCEPSSIPNANCRPVDPADGNHSAGFFTGDLFAGVTLGGIGQCDCGRLGFQKINNIKQLDMIGI